MEPNLSAIWSAVISFGSPETNTVSFDCSRSPPANKITFNIVL